MLKLTTKAASDYMKEWMFYNAIRKMNSDDNFYYFTAKHAGTSKELKIERSAIDEFFNVWERNPGELGWEWTDAIGVHREIA
ncbi:hypothetical protein ABHN11_24610 [Brevibacillus centrosporus]|uniref:hypothetical protein n=1 Tax=Brevibacillus centrosporus TaxID=54910 RepID=UPI003D25C20B